MRYRLLQGLHASIKESFLASRPLLWERSQMCSGFCFKVRIFIWKLWCGRYYLKQIQRSSILPCRKTPVLFRYPSTPPSGDSESSGDWAKPITMLSFASDRVTVGMRYSSSQWAVKTGLFDGFCEQFSSNLKRDIMKEKSFFLSLDVVVMTRWFLDRQATASNPGRREAESKAISQN